MLYMETYNLLLHMRSDSSRRYIYVFISTEAIHFRLSAMVPALLQSTLGNFHRRRSWVIWM